MSGNLVKPHTGLKVEGQILKTDLTRLAQGRKMGIQRKMLRILTTLMVLFSVIYLSTRCAPEAHFTARKIKGFSPLASLFSSAIATDLTSPIDSPILPGASIQSSVVEVAASAPVGPTVGNGSPRRASVSGIRLESHIDAAEFNNVLRSLVVEPEEKTSTVPQTAPDASTLAAVIAVVAKAPTHPTTENGPTRPRILSATRLKPLQNSLFLSFVEAELFTLISHPTKNGPRPSVSKTQLNSLKDFLVESYAALFPSGTTAAAKVTGGPSSEPGESQLVSLVEPHSNNVVPAKSLSGQGGSFPSFPNEAKLKTSTKMRVTDHDSDLDVEAPKVSIRSDVSLFALVTDSDSDTKVQAPEGPVAPNLTPLSVQAPQGPVAPNVRPRSAPAPEGPAGPNLIPLLFDINLAAEASVLSLVTDSDSDTRVQAPESPYGPNLTPLSVQAPQGPVAPNVRPRSAPAPEGPAGPNLIPLLFDIDLAAEPSVLSLVTDSDSNTRVQAPQGPMGPNLLPLSFTIDPTAEVPVYTPNHTGNSDTKVQAPQVPMGPNLLPLSFTIDPTAEVPVHTPNHPGNSDTKVQAPQGPMGPNLLPLSSTIEPVAEAPVHTPNHPGNTAALDFSSLTEQLEFDRATSSRATTQRTATPRTRARTTHLDSNIKLSRQIALQSVSRRLRIRGTHFVNVL